MADKDLSVGIGVELEVNTKKLDAIAKHIGMTGEKLQEALNFEVDTTSLEILGKQIGTLQAQAVSLGRTLEQALAGNPAGQQELLSNLRDQLALANKIKDASAQAAAPRKTGKQVDIKEAISQELFGDKTVKFNVGAYKSDLESRAKGWIEDFGDDAVELVDIASDTSKGLLQEINSAAKEAADQVGVKFKSATEMLTGFNANTLREDAAVLEVALKDLSDGLSVSGDRIINGQRVAEQDLLQSIRDFEVDSKGVFTISPAMFLDGYRRVIAKLGADLVTENPVPNMKSPEFIRGLETQIEGLEKYIADQMGGPESFDKAKKDLARLKKELDAAISAPISNLEFRSLEGDAPAQASQNVVNFYKRTLESLKAQRGGDQKIEAKIAQIEEKLILEILEKARRAGERALKDKNDFNPSMLDVYAPSADIAAIAGSADTTNLERYADEEAAKVANQLEQLYGLAEGTIAAYVKIFSAQDSDPNKLFDIVRAARAVVSSSFTDPSGANVPSATSRGLTSGNVRSIGQQIAENPAILKNLIGVQEEAFNKKVDALLQARIKDQGGLAPGDLEEAVQLALVQSLAGQISKIKISPAEIAQAVAEETVATATSSTATAANSKQSNWLDDARAKLVAAQEASMRQGKPFSVALDTEFNRNTKQSVNELSAVFRNAAGDFEEIFSFIHIPSDYKQMGRRFGGESDESYRSRAKSAEDLAARAKVLGLDASKLGDIKDPELNFQLLRKKTASLVGLLELLQELNIPITGSNVASAEGSNIGELIKFVNEMSAARGLAQFRTPANLKQGIWDSTQQFKKAKDNPEIASILGPTGKGFGLQKLITGIAESTNLKHQEWLSKYSNVFRMDPTKGSQVKLPGTGELPAHYAAADAAMSLMVQDFFDTFAETLLRMEQITMPASGLPGKPLASGGGSGKPPSQPPVTSGAADEDPMANRAVANAQRAFHTRSEYNRMLAGLTQDEYKIATDRLRLLQSDAQQVEIATQLIARESAIKDKRTELAKLRLSAPDSAEYKAVRDEVSKLDEEIIKLTNAGRKNEAATVERTLSEGRYKQMQEQVRLNTRKQIDTDFERNQAGKQFSAQIKAQLKAELEAQKAVQKANREQINQWVTARYALYDVGNFYQNLSQQLFGMTRQILNTTESYKKFETAFTSVERAMQLSADASLDMRNQFISLSEVLPVTFEDLSKIATLGAQMGISAGGIEQFTKTVAEFSAITSISADTVAQKFGRIAELANIDSSQFANLGSAVAYAGINAVATESEILTLAESIAAASEQSGFMPEEIIGMSTALASVGIQAEQARGVFTRVFADIDRAVSRGGSELDAFAKASGMSADDFAKQWGTQGQTYDVFRRLLGGIGASDLTRTFDSLNIVETREVNTLTRLANNLNVVDRAVSDANDSYAEGIFLSQSFDKTVDNLDSQLVIFKNNVDSFSAAFSKVFGQGLKETLKTASEFLKFLKGAADSPFAQAMLPAAAALTAIGGAAALATAGFSKMIAQIYAFRVAQINGMNASGTDMTRLSDRVKQLTGAYSDLVEVRGGLRGVATVEDKGVVTPVTYDASKQFAAQKDALVEFAKTRDLASARNIMNLAKQNDLLKSSNILLVTARDGSKQAIQDARAQADSIQRVIESQKSQNAAMIERFKIDDLGQAKLAARTFFVEIIDNEAVAISRGTVAELQNTIQTEAVTSAKYKEAQARLSNVKAINQETQAATTAATTFGSRVVNSLSKLLGFAAVATTIASAIGILITAVDEANKIKLLESGGGVQSLRDAITEDTKVWKETGEAVSTVQVAYTDFSAETYVAYNAITEITGANKNLKSTTGDVTESIKTQTLAIGQNTKEWMLNAIVGNDKVNSWIKENPGLFREAEAALVDYGTSFSNVIKDVLEDPQGGGEVRALAKIDGAIEKVRSKAAAYFREWSLNNPDAKRGSNPGRVYIDMLNQQKALERIKQILKEISIAMAAGLDTSSLRASLASALGAVDGLDDGVQNLTASVKTLTQWAGEVGQVMQSAFDIRYGRISALDNIRKAWSDLRKKADDARKAVKKAQDQLNSLRASRTVLEYQLNIAIKYGDSKRAAEIQAKLEENTTSTTEATDQLKEAQDALSTDLRSGSDAAIQNRAALSGLVQSYIPYLQALLNSGKSQKEVAKEVDKLKKEFASQAKEIGFAESDLKGYIGTFDSYKKIVTEMPKTVTVKVDGLDAAARAMKEFAAAVNGMKSGPIIDQATVKALSEAAMRTEAIAKYKNLSVESSLLEKRISSGAMSTRAVDVLSGALSAIRAQMKELDKRYSIVNPYTGGINAFASGGLVKGPGTGTSDSITARLSNGEFVMSAASVSTYGTDFMNALNQSRVMFAPATPQAAQSAPGSSVVYLSPDDRALLRAAIDRPVTLYADSTRLAQSVNNGNKVLAQRGVI